MIRYLIHRPTTDGKYYAVIAGLSTDTKPTANLITGSRFVEADTGARYMFDESAGQWNETDSQDQIDAAVQAWLEDHPEATTTVQDGSITKAKLHDDLAGEIDDNTAAVAALEGDVGGLKSAIEDLESYIGLRQPPEVKNGKYYSGSVGNTLQLVDNTNSVYTELFDTSDMQGERILVSIEGRNTGSRGIGFCDNDNKITYIVTESGSYGMFTLNPKTNRYEAAFDVKGSKFFCSYSSTASPTILLTIPAEINAYTKAESDSKNEVLYKMADDGYTEEHLDNFYQNAGNNRLWYHNGILHNGWSLRVTDNNFEIGYFYGSATVPAWVKSYIIDNTANYTGFAIRKTDSSDISSLTQAQLSNLIRYTYNTDQLAKKQSAQYVHFSFDDCVFWKDLIDNASNYKSAFENLFLRDLRELHDTYGCCFTLNCFCTDGNYYISNVPQKFADEFRAASTWLRFAFHAEDSSTNYTADKVAELTASYNAFVSGILKMTGTVNCIDRVTRLANFKGSLNNVLALRDIGCGITGLLTSDDDRSNYYLDSTDNTYIFNHPKLWDNTNKIMFIHSMTRLEYISDVGDFCDDVNSQTAGTFSKMLEIFSHEHQYNSTIKEKIMSMCEWLNANNYTYVFFEDMI